MRVNGARGRDEPEYELLDTGVFDEDRYWDIEVALRQGRAGRPLPARRAPQRRPGGGHAAPAPDALVPQPVVLGPRGPAAADRGRGGRGAGGPRPGDRPDDPGRERRAGAARLRERLQRAPALGPGRPRRTPRTASTTTSCTARPRSTPTARAPRRRSGTGSRSRPGRRPRCACAWPPSARDLDGLVVPRHVRPARGGRRVLRGPRPAGHAGGGARHAPGLRRDALEQAVLPLRRGPLARRRPGRPAAAAGAPAGPQRRLAPPVQPRRHLDARQVGVPLVRRLGPGPALRDPGPRRPRVRQGAAAPGHARVVHAPQRPAPGLRVELRRRQPAGARRPPPCGCSSWTGGATTSGSRASSTRCCSGSPGGPTARTRRATTCSAAASSAWTTSAPSTAPRRCRRAWPCSRRTAPAGWPCTA